VLCCLIIQTDKFNRRFSTTKKGAATAAPFAFFAVSPVTVNRITSRGKFFEEKLTGACVYSKPSGRICLVQRDDCLYGYVSELGREEASWGQRNEVLLGFEDSYIQLS
jgi:hypothetical protein